MPNSKDQVFPKPSTLIVPIRVYAIYQSNDNAVVGPEMDFESLPYFDKELGYDINPDVPYLAESVIPRPFEDTNFILKQGVHLNWDFPHFLKKTKYASEKATEFPPVPTRWLVSRFSNNNSIPDQQWIVESDALLSNLEGVKIYDKAQTSVDVDINSGDRPYTYMGRIETLDEWQTRNEDLGTNYTSWKAKQKGESLTALGWGTPSFDQFYPNCRGVFGLHDPNGTDEHTYKVVGWYGDNEDDYWLYYLKTKQAEESKKNGRNWGFAEIEAIDHLGAERKAELFKERVSKLLLEDLSIELNMDELLKLQGTDQTKATNEEKIDAIKAAVNPASWNKSILCGEAHYIDKPGLSDEPGTETLFAMGNTPTEALSAMIAEHQTKKSLGAERVKLEDSLAAMLMGDRLKSKKLDIGPKFREFRHSDEFEASQGGLQWVIENVSDQSKNNISKNDGQSKEPPPPLPDLVLPLLQELNKIQREYDKKARELESYRFQLYTDWYRYMHAAYPPPGETEEYVSVRDLRDMIEHGSLLKVKSLKKILGSKQPAGDQAISSGLRARIDSAKNNLANALTTINKEIATNEKYIEKFHWEVQQRPAPRFWEPTPPALVIAIPRQSTDDTEESNALTTPFSCSTFSGDLELTPSGFQVPLEDLFPDPKHKSSSSNPVSSDLPIFRGEWEAEVYPVATMNALTKSSGTYDPNFVTNNYLLGENEPDLDENYPLESKLGLKRVGCIYTGSAYINQKLDDRYRDLLLQFFHQSYPDIEGVTIETLATKINEIINQPKKSIGAAENTRLQTVQQGVTFLNQHDLLVITLNNFNSALLQRHESVQLNPADPLGFPGFQTFAKDVANALQDNFKGVSPDPHLPFLPIRSGGLRLFSLRLVDMFGRYVQITPTDVATSVSMMVPNHPDWVRLPPRLSQPARWNFRFLQASLPASTTNESQSHPNSTPIHGWIIPNLLDRSLDFFNPLGQRIASIQRIDDRSKGQKSAEVLSGRMQQIYDWLLSADKNSDKNSEFLDAFVRNIEEAMDNIHPDDREGQSAFSVLMGRPMAIVQLGIELELKGKPAINSNWGQLHRDLQQPDRESDGFDKVKFPYRLGLPFTHKPHVHNFTHPKAHTLRT